MKLSKVWGEENKAYGIKGVGRTGGFDGLGILRSKCFSQIDISISFRCTSYVEILIAIVIHRDTGLLIVYIYECPNRGERVQRKTTLEAPSLLEDLTAISKRKFPRESGSYLTEWTGRCRLRTPR
jgi:hypothetical protein